MTWRAMNSLLVLRAQVNAIAPNRSKASDGLVGDAAHETTSGHYPHYVAGVGAEIVTAWDCTNDPANGCDSRALSETLRRHRDPRIRYVISNREIFSSYPSGSRSAWTWGPYSGTTDPHINHAHIQALDAPISDTSTPWNLAGFESEDNMADSLIVYNTGWMLQRGVIGLQDPVVIPKDAAVPGSGTAFPNMLAKALAALQADVSVIKDKVSAAGTPGTGDDAAVVAAVAAVEKRVNALIDGVQAQADAVEAALSQ